jgi:hypothetical protein
MESKKEITAGSATIMVMMIMTILVIIGTAALHTATLLHDLAMQRIQVHQQLHSCQALMQYGVAWCKVIDDLKVRQEVYTYTLGKWPDSTSQYTGKIVITLQKQCYEIKTQLLKDTQQIAETSCLVQKGQSGWKIADFSG